MNSNVEVVSTTPGISETTLLEAAAAPTGGALKPVSGLYHRGTPAVLPAQPDNEDIVLTDEPSSASAAGSREELRLDVDGFDPQKVASGTIYRALNSRVHWIAKLAPEGPNLWTGTVWFKEGDQRTFPYTNLKIQVIRAGSQPQTAKVIYSGGGAPNTERTYQYKSPHFRSVDFEFDFVKGVTASTTMKTGAHPNRPTSLPVETLTIPTVFQRAGFDVRVSPGGEIALAGAGGNETWSDMEMHDAMQTHWSRFSNNAQWALWVFFAAMHDEGENLGGIMFDDIGPNHRQGTAIFTNSFIAQAPSGDPAPEAWVERMRFWCACHEMGHAFNLAHAWQKALGTPWIPLQNAPEARSFMNYPYNVQGGLTAFFSDFRYKFSNDELLFMRHAPERFVQMGNADWFDEHAFKQANVFQEPTFKFELRVQRPGVGAYKAPAFEFLEPVVLELKLTNVSPHPQIVPSKLLLTGHQLTVIVKRQNAPAREVEPFANYCYEPDYTALKSGDSIYDSLFASVGRGGWHIDEPGYYRVQVAVHLGTEDIVSNELMIRVMPPQDRQEEYLAQDYFSDVVGRILAFDGSRVLTPGINALQEVIDQLPGRRAALHAKVSQADATSRPYKSLNLDQKHPAISTTRPDTDGALKLMKDVIARPAAAAEALGNIDLNYYLSRLSEALAADGAQKEAASILTTLTTALTQRKAKPSVVQQVEAQRAALGTRPARRDVRKRKR